MHRYLSIVIAAMIVIAAGCGDDADTDTAAGDTDTAATAATTAATATQSREAPECDLEAASIIPAPTGQPQHVYFYRDTWPACQQQKPVVDELEQTYSGSIEFIRYDLTTEEGWCEFQRLKQDDTFADTRIPAMLYIDAAGNLVEVSNGFLAAEVLEQKLTDLGAG